MNTISFALPILLLLTFISNAYGQTSPKSSSALSTADSVVDYVRMIYDEAGNLEYSEKVYKKNPNKNVDTAQKKEVDTLAQLKPNELVNDGKQSIDEQRYLDSIARMIYVYPNPNTTGLVTIQWDGNIRHLIKDVEIYPFDGLGGTSLGNGYPQSANNNITIQMINDSRGVYIVACRLTNGKLLKIKLIRN